MSRRRAREQKRSAASSERRARWDWRLPLLLAAVFAVKALVLWQLQHHPLLEPDGGVDSAEYVALARRVLGGDLLLGPGLYYLSPLYVYFLAAALAISDSFTFVRVVQIALGTTAVWCVFVSARTWFGARAAWIAAALAALTGVFTFYEIVIFQSSIDVFLTSAALACLAVGLAPQIDQQAAPAFRRELGCAGILLGLQFINRPNIAIAIGGVVLTLLLVRRWRAAAWLTAGIAIALAPIAVRNAIVTQDLALSSSQGGLNFYIGNNAAANGQYVAVPGVRANMAGQSEDTRKIAEAAAGHSLTDAQVSAHFTGMAKTWILEHPGAAAKLFVRKLALVFNARHQWLDYSYPYYAYDTGSALAWLIVGPWLLVPLGFGGAALSLRPPSPLRPPSSAAALRAQPDFGETGSFAAWVTFLPCYAISVALFFVGERYRLPLFVPLCILSGAAIDQALQAFRKRTSDIGHRTSAAIALGIAGAIVTAWPFQLDDGRFDERLRLSKVQMNNHDYGGAAMELERAYAIRPGDTTTEFNLGMAYVTSGRAQEGLAHVRHAVEAGVELKGARYALANAMLMTGDRDGAVALLRTFNPAPDDDADSCYQVAQLAMNAGAPLVAERYLQRALQLRPGWPEALQALQQLRR